MFSGFTRWISQHVSAMFGDSLAGIMTSLEDQIIAGGAQALTNSAIKAVAAAESTGGSGADKFAAALDSVKNDLTSQGLPIIENAAQGAVIAAVAAMQVHVSDPTAGLPIVTPTAP